MIEQPKTGLERVAEDARLTLALCVVLPQLGPDYRVDRAREILLNRGDPTEAVVAVVDLVICPDCHGELDRQPRDLGCAWRHDVHLGR